MKKPNYFKETWIFLWIEHFKLPECFKCQNDNAKYILAIIIETPYKKDINSIGALCTNCVNDLKTKKDSQLIDNYVIEKFDYLDPMYNDIFSKFRK